MRYQFEFNRLMNSAVEQSPQGNAITRLALGELLIRSRKKYRYSGISYKIINLHASVWLCCLASKLHLTPLPTRIIMAHGE